MDVVAIIPFGSLEGAKSRLGAALDAEERRDLVLGMLARTINATGAATRIGASIVVSPDPAALVEAERLGARAIRQAGSGLNDGIREARVAAIGHGATAVLIVPVDLPLVDGASLDAVVAAALDGDTRDPDTRDPGTPDPDTPTAGGDRGVVAIVADRHGRGTNALLVMPPDAIEPCFGGDSAAAHRAQAMAAGARLLELGGPLALDLDTTDDLLLVEEVAPDARRVVG